MDNIKCIILDVDGTLTNDKNQITEYSKTIISELIKKNIKVILASGRSTYDVIKTSEECLASSILISNNGAIIYDYKNKKNIYESIIPKNKLKQIWDISIKYGVDCIYNSNNIRYRKYFCLDKSYNEENDIIIEDYEDIKDNVFQVVLLSDSDTNLKLCLNEVRKIGLIINNFQVGSNGIRVADINCKTDNKGTAVGIINKVYNIKKSEILCIGDSINDIEMFKKCGIKVAMKNAVSELKNQADYITDYSNNENGAALFLQKMFDKKINRLIKFRW